MQKWERECKRACCRTQGSVRMCATPSDMLISTRSLNALIAPVLVCKDVSPCLAVCRTNGTITAVPQRKEGRKGIKCLIGQSESYLCMCSLVGVVCHATLCSWRLSSRGDLARVPQCAYDDIGL
jgi:hypothetical protein